MHAASAKPRPAFFAPLARLRVVLTDTKFSSNLGAAARVMLNLGLTDLRLVRLRAELNKEAYALAVNGSEILDRAQFYDTLLEAVADCGLVVGTSRRRSAQRRNFLLPEAGAAALRDALAAGGHAALVFGSEDAGLANDDVARCHWLIGIRTGSAFESFNLSHALAIVLWEINRAMRQGAPESKRLAPAAELENFFAHFQQLLTQTGFLQENDPTRMMATLRNIFQRAALEERDVKIFRGIIRQLERRLPNPADSTPADRPD